MRVGQAGVRHRGVTVPEILVVMAVLSLLSLLLYFFFRGFLTVSGREERFQGLESQRERLLAALSSDLRSASGVETGTGGCTVLGTRLDPSGIPQPFAIRYFGDARRIWRETSEARQSFDFGNFLPPGFQVFLSVQVVATAAVTVTCGFVGSGPPPLPDRIQTIVAPNTLSR